MENSSITLPAFVELVLVMLEEDLKKRKDLFEDPENGINGTGHACIRRSRAAGYVSFGGGGRVGGRAPTPQEKRVDECDHRAWAFRSLLQRLELSPDERNALNLRLEELEKRCRPLDDNVSYYRVPGDTGHL